ncbi:MAG: hypothetical protein WDZ40_02355 [Candidatus Spechtbacterales bacterium]
MPETFPQQEKREDLDIEKYLDIIIARGDMIKRPNPEDFLDVYDEEKIKRDTGYVQKVRAKMEEYNDIIEKKAKALEILAAYYIENMHWLGEGGHAVNTSEYDDIAHGIDMVVEFSAIGGDLEDKEVKRLGLAIDAYSGKSLASLSKKAERFAKAVRGETNTATGKPYADTFARVDYFQSAIKDKDGNRYKGGLSNLPPVAVSLSGPNASDMFKTTAEIMRAENIAGALYQRKRAGEVLSSVEDEMLEKNIEKLQELKSEATKHPARWLFIKQIKKQLEVYLQIGEQSENADKEFLDNIKSAYSIIEALDSEDAELGDLQEDLDKLEKIFENLVKQ